MISIIVLSFLFIGRSWEDDFTLDFCAQPQQHTLEDKAQGLLQHNSTTDLTKYESCTCNVCDTSPYETRSETSYKFFLNKVLLSDVTQNFTYSYPYGISYIYGEWANASNEGSFSASLYTENKCVNFTINLHSMPADVAVELNFIEPRGQVTVTCTQRGGEEVSDESRMPESEKNSSDDTQGTKGIGVKVGVGVGAGLIILIIGGVSIYFLIIKRTGNQSLIEHGSAKAAGISNPSASPKTRTDINTLNIELKSATMLGYDNATGGGEARYVYSDPIYEPVGDSGYEPEEGKDKSSEHSATEEHDLAPEPNLYHRLTDYRSSNPQGCQESSCTSPNLQALPQNNNADESNRNLPFYESVSLREGDSSDSPGADCVDEENGAERVNGESISGSTEERGTDSADGRNCADSTDGKNCADRTDDEK